MQFMIASDSSKPMSTSLTHRACKAAVVFSLSVATAACTEPSAQGGRTPADEAAFMERTRCASDDTDKALAPVLSGDAVQRVQPLYSTIEGAKSGHQAELRGAIVTVSALPGVTAEWLDRALECHSAKEVLGHEPTPSDDPFWLPRSTVNIDVTSDRDGFNIAISAYSANDARQILDRANAFEKAKAAAAPKPGGIAN
jgi:hypothetical protein